MRALLPLLSVGRGWRVGAAARPPRRVMSLYRTEELGHPRSQDYRLFFSKSLAQLRAGPRRSRGAELCPAGSAARAQARGGGDGSRRGANRSLQRPQPARGASLLPLTSAPWPAARPLLARAALPGAAEPFPLRTDAELWGPGASLRNRVCLRPRPCCQRRRTRREEVGGECEPGIRIGLCAHAIAKPFVL